MFQHFFIVFIGMFFMGNTKSVSQDLVKITIDKVIIYAGKSSMIKVGVEVKKGYHIQANKVSDEFMIPTVLEIKSVRNILLDKQLFPSSKKFKLVGTDNYLDVFDGIFEIGVPFQTKAKINKGKYSLEAKLHYQACDSKRCLFPKNVNFVIPIEVR